MKLTPDAAMRARDVSRPRAEHLAEAEVAEVGGSAGRESPGQAETGSPETGSPETGGAAAGATRDDLAGQPGFPRRRGPRGGGRRGRSSR